MTQWSWVLPFPQFPSSVLVFRRQNAHGKQRKVLGTRANVGDV